MEKKPVSSAKEWREKGRGTEVITLPSGVSVEIKKPDLMDLVFAGTIPLSLANSMETMGKRMVAGQMTDEDIQEIGRLMNDVLVALSINPKVVHDGQLTKSTESENVISVNEIMFSDKFDFFQKIMKVGGESKALLPFRGVKQSPASGGGSRKVRSKTKRSNRNKKSGSRA